MRHFGWFSNSVLKKIEEDLYRKRYCFCIFSISDVMRCILRTKPKNWMLRKYFQSLLKPADIGSCREISSFVSFVCFFKEKDILEFPLEKRCKRKRREECRTKDHQLLLQHLCLLLTFNTMHLGMDGSILINVMEKFPLSERRSMSKERSRHDIGRRRTSLTFSFLFAFSLRKYLCLLQDVKIICKVISSH